MFFFLPNNNLLIVQGVEMQLWNWSGTEAKMAWSPGKVFKSPPSENGILNSFNHRFLESYFFQGDFVTVDAAERLIFWDVDSIMQPAKKLRKAPEFGAFEIR